MHQGGTLLIVNASERLWPFDDRLELIPYRVAKSTANLLRYLVVVSARRGSFSALPQGQGPVTCHGKLIGETLPVRSEDRAL